MGIFRREPVGKLFHVERAHQNRPGAAQARDDGRVGGRGGIGGIDLRARQRHHPFDIEQVLHGKGHACQRR